MEWGNCLFALYNCIFVVLIDTVWLLSFDCDIWFMCVENKKVQAQVKVFDKHTWEFEKIKISLVMTAV